MSPLKRLNWNIIIQQGRKKGNGRRTPKEIPIKTKQHNVVIHPRLKPVPFKNLDLNPASLPEPNAATTINEIEFFKLKIYH